MEDKSIKIAIKEADKWTRGEFIKYGIPIWAYETGNQAGQELATYFKVDKDLILLGTILMDIKLGEALKQDLIKEHVSMSHNAAEEFLNKFDIIQEDKIKILDGIKYHHGTDEFPSLESEIIMNADCYKFLTLENIKKYFKVIKEERITSLPETIEFVRGKFEEKKKNLTLDYCKQELEPNYKAIEDFLSNAN